MVTLLILSQHFKIRRLNEANSNRIQTCNIYRFGSNRCHDFYIQISSIFPSILSAALREENTKALTSVLQLWSTSPTYPAAHSQPFPLLRPVGWHIQVERNIH